MRIEILELPGEDAFLLTYTPSFRADELLEECRIERRDLLHLLECLIETHSLEDAILQMHGEKLCLARK